MELVGIVSRRAFCEGQDNLQQKKAQEYHWVEKVRRGAGALKGCQEPGHGAVTVEYPSRRSLRRPQKHH